MLLRTKIGYASGDLGLSIAYFAVGFFFLFYLTVLLLVSFAALLALYLWEGRHALDEDSEEAP